MKNKFKYLIKLFLWFILILFFNINLMPSDLSIDNANCNKTEIYYERYIVGHYKDNSDKVNINFHTINYWEYIEKNKGERQIEPHKFYIYLIGDFNNDTISFSRDIVKYIKFEQFSNSEIIYSKILWTNEKTNVTDSFNIDQLWDPSDERYYTSNFEMKVNNINYKLSIENDLIFILIHYNQKIKVIKIINTNKIPEF